MTRDFFDPTPEQQIVVESATLRQAERLIESCEVCNREHAEILFDSRSMVLYARQPQKLAHP